MTLTVDIAARFTAPGAEPFVVDAAFEVADGESLVVLGPSGSGKTLLLEAIAGFHPSKGSVENDGRDLTNHAPEERDFGFVFQDYALFPHMTVRENVAFGARYHDDARDPETVLGELGVADLVDRTPPTLSGGESQRVALARSLAIRPEAFLLDEPLSALDVPTQQSLRNDLADVLGDVTAVYVTHDRTTARALADRIAVMHDGEIVQIGSADEVFERPRSPFVARFTGANCLPLDALGALGGDLADAAESKELPTHLAIRPEHVALDADDPDFVARVIRVTREDATNRITLALPGTATGDRRPIGVRSTDGGCRTRENGNGRTDRDGDENGTRDRNGTPSRASKGETATIDAFSARSLAVGEERGIALPDEHVTPLDASDDG